MIDWLRFDSFFFLGSDWPCFLGGGGEFGCV